MPLAPRSIFVVVVLLPRASWSFAPLAPLWQIDALRTTFHSALHATTSTATNNNNNNNNSNNNAEFDYQEMRAQLEAMERQRVASKDLSLVKREEIQQYIANVATNRPSTIPLKEIARVLPNTKWRLTFSTQEATLGDLPRDATVFLEFHDDNLVNYILEFSEATFGLNRLVAKSSYVVDGVQNPGLVTFVYKDIVTDIFGMKNIGVGFFGLLKGRANYVESIFMDGRFWIERGYTVDGKGTYYNVYMKQGVGRGQ